MDCRLLVNLVLVGCAVLGSCALAEADCPEEPLFKIIPAANIIDEGFRPLGEEDSPDSGPRPGMDESGYWRPQTTPAKDCESRTSSLLEPEDRGYRPLDYGVQQGAQQAESGDRTRHATPYWGGHQQRYSSPQYSPAYPDYRTNPWYQGGYGHPQYYMPPFIPGYGVMPFSFGGSTFPY